MVNMFHFGMFNFNKGRTGFGLPTYMKLGVRCRPVRPLGLLVGTLCSLNLFPDHKLTKEAKRGERAAEGEENFAASEDGRRRRRSGLMSTGKRMEGRKGRRELAGIFQSDREERETTDRDGAWMEGPTTDRREA